jgi:hypothetical protein
VFIISILSLGGLLAFPFIYKISFQYILVTFTALAVGTLFGDTMFHLIPFVCINFVKNISKENNFKNHLYILQKICAERFFSVIGTRPS